MAKAQVIIPSRVYQAGQHPAELPNLSSDDTGIKASFTRESWPDTGDNVITGVIEGSNDNDQTRFQLAPFAFPGGDQIDKHGNPVTASWFLVTWPELNGVPQRPGRVFATITNSVSLRTQITLDGV